jgi:tRNA A-37 threonylcarbamoyl transferase component Bud32
MSVRRRTLAVRHAVVMALPKGWIAAPGNVTIESGQAWVHKACRTNDPAHSFALKILRNTKRIGRFAREIEAMNLLAASGIEVPPIVEYALDGRRPYFVVPWFEDGSLERNVVSRAFVGNAIEGIDVLRRLATIVAKIHRAGYAHRDLKPANVLVAGDRMAVCDFGLTLAADAETSRMTATAEAVGSRLYIAPENESGVNDSLDQRPADFFAFAKIIYALLAGCAPRHGMADLSPGHRLADVTGEEKLDRLAALQKDLLHPDPRARLQDWAQVISELEHVRAGLTTADDESGGGTLAEDVLRSARRYAASADALSFQEHRRAGVARKDRAKELEEALAQGFNQRVPDIIRAREMLLDAPIVISSGAGVHRLSQMRTHAVVAAAMAKGGLEWRETHNPSTAGEGDVSPIMVTLHDLRPGRRETLHVAAYAIVLDDAVWALRIPISIVDQPADRQVLVPARLYDTVGSLIGPLHSTGEVSRAALEEFGRETAIIGLELMKRVLDDPAQGLAHL